MENLVAANLKIEPSDGRLVFTGPFDDMITIPMTLENPSKDKLTYKIKTTVPNLFCVKPKIGFIQAEEKVSVDIILMADHEKFNPKDHSRHKFLVQWMKIPYPESLGDYRNCTATEANHFWNDADVTLVKGKRLSCIYEMPVFEEPTFLSVEDSAYASNDEDVQQDKVEQTSRATKSMLLFGSVIFLVLAVVVMLWISTEDQITPIKAQVTQIVEDKLAFLLGENFTYPSWL